MSRFSLTTKKKKDVVHYYMDNYLDTLNNRNHEYSAILLFKDLAEMSSDTHNMKELTTKHKEASVVLEGLVYTLNIGMINQSLQGHINIYKLSNITSVNTKTTKIVKCKASIMEDLEYRNIIFDSIIDSESEGNRDVRVNLLGVERIDITDAKAIVCVIATNDYTTGERIFSMPIYINTWKACQADYMKNCWYDKEAVDNIAKLAEDTFRITNSILTEII